MNTRNILQIELYTRPVFLYDMSLNALKCSIKIGSLLSAEAANRMQEMRWHLELCCRLSWGRYRVLQTAYLVGEGKLQHYRLSSHLGPPMFSCPGPTLPRTDLGNRKRRKNKNNKAL